MFHKQVLLLSLLLIDNSLQLTKGKKEIFQETEIKNLKIPNRLIRGSVGDYCFFPNGHITNEALEFYDKLSNEGAGIIFIGYTTISDYDQYDDSGVFRIDKDEHIEEYKKLVSIIHKNKRKAIMQIVHIGAQTLTKTTDKLYAPSKVINPISNRTTYEMTKEDILRIEDDFVKASIRAKKAGFDGIEIHGAHFYLVSDFLSPIFNKRTDEYGGNDENRARFLVEIIEKIRKAVGNDFIISVKINCDDGFPGGISEEGFILACKLAEKAGVDMIQVSGMGWFKIKAKDAPALFFERASKVAEVLNIPVILIGNIRDVETAQNILNKSNIEYVGIARPLICEVDLVQKWTNGDFKKSKCVSCNSCLNKYSTCVFNKGKRLYP